jgi:hypothetical protein
LSRQRRRRLGGRPVGWGGRVRVPLAVPLARHASRLGPAYESACLSPPSLLLCHAPCMIADSLVQEAIGEALISPRLSWHGVIPRLSRPLSRSILPRHCTDCRMKSRKKMPPSPPFAYSMRHYLPRPYSLAPFAPSLWGNNRPTHQRIMIC